MDNERDSKRPLFHQDVAASEIFTNFLENPMSAKFIKFTASDGGEVFVNPLLVRYFCSLYAHHEENLTRIVFDDENAITANVSLADAQKLLML